MMRTAVDPAVVSHPAWCSIGLLGLLLTALPAPAYEWHIATVDSTGTVGYSASLALDGSGNPHISYCEGTDYDLRYAYHGGSVWHIATVDSEGGASSSLALDSEGFPHISYYDWIGVDVKYARQDGSGWHIEVVDSQIALGSNTSLRLDEVDLPHIGYWLVGWPEELRYARRDGSGWHVETVDSGGAHYDSRTSLVLDAGGLPRMSYYSGHPNRDLRYAYKNGSGWHIETVDSVGDVGWDMSLTLDGDGRTHISYCEAQVHLGGIYPAGLKYAHQDGSGWHIETVDSAGWAGLYISLALDGWDLPHISYCDSASYPWGGPADLKYARHDGTGWHIEAVDSTNVWAPASNTSLALDGSGYPHIGYYDGVSGDLKYAYAAEPVAGEEASGSATPRLGLLRVSPNPASTEATILCSLGDGGGASTCPGVLKIFDRVGRLVAVPRFHASQAGKYSIRWNLTSLDGKPVAPGVYYLRLGAGNTPATDVGRLVVSR